MDVQGTGTFQLAQRGRKKQRAQMLLHGWSLGLYEKKTPVFVTAFSPVCHEELLRFEQTSGDFWCLSSKHAWFQDVSNQNLLFPALACYVFLPLVDWLWDGSFWQVFDSLRLDILVLFKDT